MKKVLFLVACAAITFIGCQKMQEATAPAAPATEVMVSTTVAAPAAVKKAPKAPAAPVKRAVKKAVRK